MRTITVYHDFERWREAARSLLAAGVPPTDVFWTDGDGGALFDGAAVDDAARAWRDPFTVPKRFIDVARHVAAHRGDGRWAALYGVLWRLTHGEPHVLDLAAVDDDVARVLAMDRAVRHDVHRMHAFVRFRKVATPGGNTGGERYVAWHRPDHRVLRLAVPLFRERFGGAMRWAILTPDESATWDGRVVRYGPGVARRDAPPSADELEDAWRAYYASTFNPARASEPALVRHLPRRYWAALPEATIIDDLLRGAARRTEDMVAKSAKNQAYPTAAAFMPEAIALPQLRAAAAVCKGCDLYRCGTQTVFGAGPADADVMFVGEQPGDMEDRAGQPFVGPAGQVLDDALVEVGIDRSAVYVTNAVKHFKWEPRGKRRIHSTPTVREQQACRPWLEAEIAAVAPKLIVCLGATAAQALLGKGFRVTQQRGEVLESTGWAPAVIATVHPSSILRQPDPPSRDRARAAFVEDLRIVRREIAKVSAAAARTMAAEKERTVRRERQTAIELGLLSTGSDQPGVAPSA